MTLLKIKDIHCWFYYIHKDVQIHFPPKISFLFKFVYFSVHNFKWFVLFSFHWWSHLIKLTRYYDYLSLLSTVQHTAITPQGITHILTYLLTDIYRYIHTHTYIYIYIYIYIYRCVCVFYFCLLQHKTRQK